MWGRGCYTATLLNLVLKHLEGTKTHILVEKLLSFGVDFCLIGWIHDLLTDRIQRVWDRVNGCLSEVLSSFTGSPQGCVLSPLLYILYTDDCRSRYENRFIVKYADDSAIVILFHADENDHGLVDDFVQWCDNAFLQINVLKTKDMHIDFRRNQSDIKRTNIKIRRLRLWNHNY